MALRKAEILQDRREGRYVYYRLKDEAIFGLVREAARLQGLDPQNVDSLATQTPRLQCECPHCAPTLIPVNSLQLS
jgi:hypothetical protein